MVDDAKKEIQKQIIQHQLNEMHEQLQRIEQQVAEVSSLKEGIEDFSKLKKGDEMLVPLANGIFVRAQLLDVDSLKINVGAGVLVEKTCAQALDLIEEQYKAILKLRDEVMEQFNFLLASVQQMGD